MKTFLYLPLFLLALAFPARADTLLFDDFNGTSINTTIWQEYLPFGGSSLVEGGGNLTTTGRGTLASIAGFNDPLEISGRFVLNDGLEHFKVIFQSDFSIYSPLSSTAERNGVLVSFAGGALAIQQFDNANQGSSGILVQKGYSFASGVPYDFNITIVGSAVSVSVNGINELSGTSSISVGNRVGFFSREFGSTSTSVDYFQVAAVPEPGVYGVLFGVLGLAGAVWRRKIA